MCPDGFVYNLEVAHYHTYVANGFVVHNCHHTPSKSMGDVISRMPARHLIGLSATPHREDGLGPLMFDLLGPAKIEIPRRMLVEKGHLIQPQVRIIRTGFQYERTDDEDGKNEWAAMQRARASSARRNALVCRVAAAEFTAGHSVVVLVELKGHARLLERILRIRHKLPASAVVGDLDPAIRRRIYPEVEAGKRILIATKLFNEGMDLPGVDRILLGAPIKSATTTEQQTGRGARPAKGKDGCIVYDFADVNVDTFLKHAKRRVEIYRQLGYDVRVLETGGGRK